jgi:predicted dehydrogenase
VNMDQRRVDLAVVGCGRIAQAAHLPAIEKCDGVRLRLVCDRSERLARGVGERYGVPWTTDADAALEAEVGAVVLCVPDRFHHPVGLAALAAGKHVLMEKPMAETVEQAAELAAVATAGGLVLQTGFMKRHDPAVRFAREHLAAIGPVLSARSWYRVMAASRADVQDTLFPALVVDDEVRAVESGFKADGQRYRLMTHGAHLFDGLRALAGELAWLSVRTASQGDDITWHGTGGLVDGGGLASFEITTSVHSQWSEGVDLYGERGHIRIRSPYVFSRLGSQVDVFLESEGRSVVPRFADTNPFKLQLDAFAAAVLTGTPPDPGPDDGVAATRLVLAAAESAADDGRSVRL